jgi:hypothetical protein
MRNRLLNITLTWGLDLLSIFILIGIAFLLYQMGLGDHRILVFFVLMLTALLPVFNYLHDLIDSSVSPIGYDDLFVKTVDAVLNMRSFDEILKETFDQVLDFMKIRSGILIFYYPDRDEYSIFYQKNRKKRMIRNARIENDNIIFNMIKGPDDIIIRSRLTRDNYDRAILHEMDKLHGETMVPIYFQTTFLGVIVTGKRNRKFSSRELSLLKIFASKIAILSINNFFLNDLLKKKELEKEYELASKIHDRFMPEPEITIGRAAVRIHHRTSSLMTREFYDVFSNHADPDDIRLTAYRLRGDITGTSIYMPGIQALIQSYSRLGNSPRETVYKLLGNMKEREIIDEELAVFVASVNQKGSVTCYNHGYPAPLIFRHAQGALAALPRRQGDSESKFKLERGDILIICSESFSVPLASETGKYSDLVRENSGLSLSKLRGTLVKSLPQRPRGDDRDTLLMLLRLEDG